MVQIDLLCLSQQSTDDIVGNASTHQLVRVPNKLVRDDDQTTKGAVQTQLGLYAPLRRFTGQTYYFLFHSSFLNDIVGLRLASVSVYVFLDIDVVYKCQSV